MIGRELKNSLKLTDQFIAPYIIFVEQMDENGAKFLLKRKRRQVNFSFY